MPRRKERQEPAGGAPFYRCPASDPYRVVCDPNGSHHHDVWYVATTWPHTIPLLTISYHPQIITTLQCAARSASQSPPRFLRGFCESVNMPGIQEMESGLTHQSLVRWWTHIALG
jgi:hypothetical protein